MPIDVAAVKHQLAILRGTIDDLERTVTTNVIRLHPGQSVQAALDLAEAGSVIELEPGAYEGSLTFRRPVTLRPTVEVPPGRRTREFEPVTLLSTGEAARIFGPDVHHLGLAYRSTNQATTLIVIAPGTPRTILDRPLVLGDAELGQKRGIAAEGIRTRILGAYVDDIWRVGQDSQAIFGANGTRDLVIDDCYLAAAGESVMFGGADSASPDLMPADIVLTNSVLTKNPAWYDPKKKAQIKCAFELKAARHVVVQHVELAYAGKSEGQGGYLCLLTCRNQNGKAPWSVVEDVLMEDIVGHHAGGILNVLGQDNNHPSGTLTGAVLRRWTCHDIDPLLPACPGDGRLIQIQRWPAQLTLEEWEVGGAHLNIGLHVLGIGLPPPTGLTLRRVHLPACSYSVKVDKGGAGSKALRAYAPDAVLEDVTTGGQPV
jgi:hypothetical protein